MANHGVILIETWAVVVADHGLRCASTGIEGRRPDLQAACAEADAEIGNQGDGAAWGVSLGTVNRGVGAGAAPWSSPIAANMCFANGEGQS